MSIGLFRSVIQIAPQMKEIVFEAIKIIVEEGEGGHIIEEIQPKRFKQSLDDYILEIKNLLVMDESHYEKIYLSLEHWCGSWEKKYEKSSIGFLKDKMKSEPIKVWAYCLLKGKLDLYNELTQNHYIVISKEHYQKISERKIYNKHENLTYKNEENKKYNQLLKLYELDSETRIKHQLLNKSIAIFTERKEDSDILAIYKSKYHLKNIVRYSSLEIPSAIPSVDYIIFVTTRATHSVRFRIESMFNRKNIYYSQHSNYDEMFKDFVEQLEGNL